MGAVCSQPKTESVTSEPPAPPPPEAKLEDFSESEKEKKDDEETEMQKVNNQRLWAAQVLVRRMLRTKEVVIFGTEECENCKKMSDALKYEYKLTSFNVGFIDFEENTDISLAIRNNLATLTAYEADHYVFFGGKLGGDCGSGAGMILNGQFVERLGQLGLLKG